MGLVTWILVGLVAGLIAGWALKGGPGGGGLRGIVLTVGVGVLGAIVGGLVSSALGYGGVTGFNFRSIVIAVGGSIVVIAAWRIVFGKR